MSELPFITVSSPDLINFVHQISSRKVQSFINALEGLLNWLKYPFRSKHCQEKLSYYRVMNTLQAQKGRQILLNEFRQIIKNKRNHSSITAFKRSWELFISDQRFQTQVTILRQEITLVDTLWGTFESASNWVLNCPVAFAIFNLAHP